MHLPAGATGEIAKEREYEDEDDTCDVAEASVLAYAGSSHASRLNTGSQVSGLTTGSSCEEAIGKELEKLADRAGVIAGRPPLPSLQLQRGCCSLGHPGFAEVEQLAIGGVPFCLPSAQWHISLHKLRGIKSQGHYNAAEC